MSSYRVSVKNISFLTSHLQVLASLACLKEPEFAEPGSKCPTALQAAK
jgi:hypothetical protein